MGTIIKKKRGIFSFDAAAFCLAFASILAAPGCRSDQNIENGSTTEQVERQEGSPTSNGSSNADAPSFSSESNDLFSRASLSPGERAELTIAGAVYGFCWIPPGRFLAGSPEDEENRCENETRHEVTIGSGFWLMESETPQALWSAIVGSNPSEFQGDDLPVECVSWDECQDFVAKLNAAGFAPQGWTFALPTEAQWEYACRAGCDAVCPESELNDFAQYSWNSEGRTLAVMSKRPNAWGLYDTLGNVWEWTADWYGDYPQGAAIDPAGPETGADRVERGGSWYCGAELCRPAYRNCLNPASKIFDLGVRVALIRAS